MFDGGAKDIDEGGANCSAAQPVFSIKKSPPVWRLTVHRPWFTSIAIIVATVSPLQSVGIQHIFPISDFSDLFVAISILFVIVRSTWIINIVPVLGDLFSLPVLLPLLASTTLPLLTIEVVDIIVISCPICERRFHWLRSLRGRRRWFWSAGGIFHWRRGRESGRGRNCRSWRSEFARYGFRFGFLSRYLRSSCWLKL